MARYELNYENPLQLLVATILAAQCTDERVNQVTPALFAKYPDATRLRRGRPRANWKRTSSRPASTRTRPRRSRRLPGPGRALRRRGAAHAWRRWSRFPAWPARRPTSSSTTPSSIPSGVIVDTHVRPRQPAAGTDRERRKPEQIEQDLMEIVPQDEWMHFGPAMVLHGRYICTSRRAELRRVHLQRLLPEESAWKRRRTSQIRLQPTCEDRQESRTRVPRRAAPRSIGRRRPRRRVRASRTSRNWRSSSPTSARSTQVFPPEDDVFNAFQPHALRAGEGAAARARTPTTTTARRTGCASRCGPASSRRRRWSTCSRNCTTTSAAPSPTTAI